MAYSSIVKPTDYFNTVLYTGNGTARTITTDLTSTDFIWNKRRDSTGNHMLYDVVRGINKDLNSDSTEAEETQVGTVTAFGSNSYTLGTHGGTNANGEIRVSWNWSANGSGSSNSDGSITSTVSANTTAGFSIVTWTSLASGSNYTVGHGLGSTPAMIILKGRHESNSWLVYHHKNTSSPETDYLELNSTAATADYPVWNDTAPTSSVFTCGTWSGFDAGGTMVAYCFAEKKGYSKFRSYTGNGNADGTFIHTGFKPAFVMFKRSDGGSENWLIYDNTRNPSNVVDKRLYPDASDSEDTGSHMDFVSNGIKLKTSTGGLNTSGSTYIYMAFAEAPFVTAGTKAAGTAR